MAKPRSRVGTGAGARIAGRIINVRDRRDRETEPVALRRSVSRKTIEAQRLAVVVWDEV